MSRAGVVPLALTIRAVSLTICSAASLLFQPSLAISSLVTYHDDDAHSWFPRSRPGSKHCINMKNSNNAQPYATIVTVVSLSMH